MTWDRLADWWIEEVATDPAYDEEIAPLLLELLEPEPKAVYLDLGCGDGRIAARIIQQGTHVVGCDLNMDLLRLAIGGLPVVKTKLPDLSWARSAAFAGAYLDLVLEHLEDETSLFADVARVVKPGGVLALVANHPIWTAPQSSPIEDAEGETLWRMGRYFGRGFSDEPAGDHTVRFYHRTLADLLNAASNAGWDLSKVHESGISERQMRRFPEYAGQQEIPRIIGLRWLRRSS